MKIVKITDNVNPPISARARGAYASLPSPSAIAIGMSGGYAFARYRFRGKSTLFLGFMLTRTVPGIALSLPLFILYARLGVIDTHLSLIVTYVALNVPVTIWLIEGFFRQVPKDLAEAAQSDGCTRWQAFWTVEFPLAGPGIAPADCGPTIRRPPSKRQIEPPPAATVWMRSIGARMRAPATIVSLSRS